MKDTAFMEQLSATFEVDAKGYASVDTDSDTSEGELSSHCATYHTSQFTSNEPRPTCVSWKSIFIQSTSGGADRVSFDALSNDLLLVILGFCDTASTRKATQTNHRLRGILASQEGDSIRREICYREWPWINPTCEIVDDLHVPMHCLHEAAVGPNALFLVSLAAQKMSRRLVLATWRHLTSLSSNYEHLQSLQLPDGRHAIQYQGPIGEGNRSIQADRPLPRPHKLTRQQIRRSMEATSNHRSHSTLHNFLHRIFNCLPQSQRPIWRPFVAPFMAEDAVHITPRLISYFEVLIESPKDYSNGAAFRLNNNHFNGPLRPSSSGRDCIVVGLCTRKFHLSNRMAGWDNQSFGYHSDDGGVYHKKGHMLRKYGPAFGAGDTVGCGVDYQRRAIFFTLNGKFIGYAFDKLSLKILNQDLYPVVGLDTHCPVVCNFGCKQAFLFDLKSMVCDQSSIVFQSLLIDQNKEL